MLLLPPDSPELLQLAVAWLGHRDNYQWLDFGDGRQLASREWLKLAMQRQTTLVRVFTSDREYQPIGLVGFNSLNAHFRTATLWVVLGEKSYAHQGYATRASAGLLTYGFAELGLRSIQTWVVEHSPALAIARRLGFSPIGRQRQCHIIDGRVYDRFWFDLLGSEHKEWRDERSDAVPRADNAAVL